MGISWISYQIDDNWVIIENIESIFIFGGIRWGIGLQIHRTVSWRQITSWPESRVSLIPRLVPVDWRVVNTIVALRSRLESRSKSSTKLLWMLLLLLLLPLMLNDLLLYDGLLLGSSHSILLSFLDYCAVIDLDKYYYCFKASSDYSNSPATSN